MKSVFTIAAYDLLITFKERNILLISFLMPVIMMAVLAAAIRDEEVRLLVDVVDRDESALSEVFIRQLEDSGGDTIVVCVYGRENPDECGLNEEDEWNDVGKERLEESDTAAALIIPAGFGATLEQGQTATLEYRSDDSLNAPTLVSQVVSAALNRTGSSVVIARLGIDPGLEELTGATNANDAETFSALYAQAEQSWQTPPAMLEEESSGEEVEVGAGANQSVPGISSMFVLISMLNGAIGLLTERKNGTLQRLFTLPLPKYQTVMGKMASAVAYGLIQFVVLLVFGTFLGVDFGGDWLAIAILVVSFVLCGGALGFLLATLVKSDAQAGGIAALMSFTLAPLGGAWWPLTIVPDAMRTIGHISPIAWVMDGFQELIYYNGAVADVLPHAGVLLAMAAGLAILGVWRFRYE